MLQPHVQGEPVSTHLGYCNRTQTGPREPQRLLLRVLGATSPRSRRQQAQRPVRPAPWSTQPATSWAERGRTCRRALWGLCPQALSPSAGVPHASPLPSPPRPRPWARHTGRGRSGRAWGAQSRAVANACAPWPPAVSQHRGAAGQRLLRRGGEGRQAPAGGRPACRRGRGAEPGLPGLRGEPPAGPVPAWGPLLGQRPPATPRPSKAGGGGPWRLPAVNSVLASLARRGRLRAVRGQERAGRRHAAPRLREQGHAGSGGPAGARASHHSDP